MTTNSPALAPVVKAARAYRRAQEKRNAALRALQDAIRAADGAGGVTKNAIIDAAGVGRQTVYDALKSAR